MKRSEFAGHAAYGYCAAHSRHFWGFKLYLLCATDGMPIAHKDQLSLERHGAHTMPGLIARVARRASWRGRSEA